MNITPTQPSPTALSDARSKAQDLRQDVIAVAKDVATQVKENHPTIAANIGDRIEGRVDARQTDRQTRRQDRWEARAAEIKNSRNDQGEPTPDPETITNAGDGIDVSV